MAVPFSNGGVGLLECVEWRFEMMATDNFIDLYILYGTWLEGLGVYGSCWVVWILRTVTNDMFSRYLLLVLPKV